jgi:hypothetical protein
VSASELIGDFADQDAGRRRYRFGSLSRRSPKRRPGLRLDAIVEPSICDPPDGFFEGGDRATLVRLSQARSFN